MEDIKLVYIEPDEEIVEIDSKYVKSMESIRSYFDSDDLDELVLPVSGLTIYKLVPFARVSKNVEYKININE